MRNRLVRLIVVVFVGALIMTLVQEALGVQVVGEGITPFIYDIATMLYGGAIMAAVFVDR